MSAARARTTSQMAANADAMNGINSAMTTLASDGQRLDQLQANATGASGQMQALSYANQFAAQQASELQKIRGVLLAQRRADGPIAISARSGCCGNGNRDGENGHQANPGRNLPELRSNYVSNSNH